MSDWELHDIGIARGKIEHVVMNRSIDSRGARSENRQSSCIVWAIRVPPMRGTAGAEKWPKSAAPKNKFRQPIQSDLGRPDRCSKIIRFSFPPNQLHLRAIPPHRRGAYASSRYVECGERWTRWRCAREVLQGGLNLCFEAVSDRSAQDEWRSSRTAKACGLGVQPFFRPVEKAGSAGR